MAREIPARRWLDRSLREVARRDDPPSAAALRRRRWVTVAVVVVGAVVLMLVAIAHQSLRASRLREMDDTAPRKEAA